MARPGTFRLEFDALFLLRGQRANKSDGSLDFVVSEIAFESGHVTFSVRDGLDQLRIRFFLDFTRSEVCYLQTLSHSRPGAICSMAGDAFRLENGSSVRSILTRCRVGAGDDGNNDKYDH